MYNKIVNIGLHHLLNKYKYSRKDQIISNTTFTNFINKGVYCASIFGILIVLPQSLKIWLDKDTSGVSLITWSGFLVGSFFWLFYGIVHKEKPIIFTNIAGILMNLSIIIGLIFTK